MSSVSSGEAEHAASSQAGTQDEVSVSGETPKRSLTAALTALTSRALRAAKGPALITLRVALAGLLIAAGFSAYRLVDRYARSAEHFAIGSISIEGADHRSEEHLQRIAGVEIGQNIFQVTPELIQSRLEDDPWVATAVVERRLPGTLRISIRERRAVALLALESETFLVGDDGSVFKPVEPSDAADFPIITGLADGNARFRQDADYRAAVLLNAITLMHDYRASGLSDREVLSEIHVEASGVSIYIGNDGVLVRLGEGGYRRKLRRLRAILDRLDDAESRPEYIFLDNRRRRDRVTVRLRSTEPPPPESEESEAEQDEA